jgi:hypothetical protein
MSKIINAAEARRIALKTVTDADEQRRASFAAEIRMENHLTFAEYGEDLLILMIDKGCRDCETGLSDVDFEAKYKTTKQQVNYALILLQMAIEQGDHEKKKDMYDYFIDLLS